MKNLPLSNPSYRYLEQSFRQWLDIQGYAKSTVENLPNHARELLHNLEQQGIEQISELTPEIIGSHYKKVSQRQNQRSGGGLSNAYLNKHRAALLRFCAYLRQSGRKNLLTPDLDQHETNQEQITLLSVEEIQNLYQAAAQIPEYASTANKPWLYEWLAARDKVLLSIYYGCGLRRSEGQALNLSDINFDHRALHVRKGKNYKERFVPFNKTTSQTLQEWIYDWRGRLATDREALFVSARGNRANHLSLSIRLKVLQQRSGNIELQQKNISLHTLRHSIATHLLQAGMELEKISRFLGHSSLESTQIYTHLV